MSKGGKMLNIGGDANDASYRYKMPALVTKVEGRGNGIKTILVNITDVCKHLHTEPQYATRFFGIECGAVSKWDDKRDAGIVHGVHERAELQKSLNKFIREFILCPKCKMPELQMKVQEKKSILMIRCAACGHKGKNISTHKVKAYMINHPPKKKKKPESGKSSDRRDKKKGKGASSSSSSSSSSSNKEDPDITLAKQQAADFNQLGGADAETWTEDVTDEAVAKRRFEEMKTFAHFAANTDTAVNGDNENKKDNNNDNNNNNNNNDNGSDENKDSEKIDPYRTQITSFDNSKDSGPSQILRGFINEQDRKIYEILDEIKRLGLAHNLDETKKFKVTFEATCKIDNANNLIASLKKPKNIELFQQLNSNDKDSRVFFGCLEEIIAKRNPDALLPKTYMILEAIYDCEIATEEQILAWYEIESDKALLVLRDEAEQVRKMAKPFITWLQEADEDDDDDDEDGDDVVDVE